jgi:hypothetical protein
LNEKFYKRKRIVLFSKFNFTFVMPDYFWDTTSVSKEESLKSFVAFLKKVCLILRFQTMKLQKKVFVVNMTFNFNQNFIMNTPKIKTEAVCPTKKMPVRSNEKKYIMDILKLIRF